ncbi:hypothetical protein ACIHFD_19630 [Nonomuraea sp. NPDC051941]|uniref:hypothetical protein n=1 Tax=Nonomuraea sp. NPDC051941 TaxID=3364373 RepID=UPI0037CB081D
MAMVYARSPSLETGDDLDAVAGTRAREGGTESTLSDELSDIRNALPRSPVHNPVHENIEFQDTLKPVARLSVPARSYLASAYFSLRNDYDSAVHQATCRLAANYPPGTEPGSIVPSCHAIPGWTARATNIQLTRSRRPPW